MPNDNPENTPQDNKNNSITFLKGVSLKIWTKISESIILALLVPLGVVWWALWSDIKSYTNGKAADLIAEYIQYDLNKGEKSVILRNARDVISKQVAEFIGSVTVGSFYFSEASPEGRIYIVAPPKHKVKMLVETERLPDGFRLELQPDCAKGTKAVEKSGVALISLDKFIAEAGEKRGCKTSDTLNVLASSADDVEIVDTLGARIRNMHSFTLKLVGPKKFSLATPVLVKYVAVVNPPLRTGELPLQEDAQP